MGIGLNETYTECGVMIMDYSGWGEGWTLMREEEVSLGIQTFDKQF